MLSVYSCLGYRFIVIYISILPCVIDSFFSDKYSTSYDIAVIVIVTCQIGREATADAPAVPSSQAATNTAPLPVFDISSQMRSRIIHKSENKASSSNVSTVNDMGRLRRDVSCSLTEKTGGTLLQPFGDVESTSNGKSRRPWSSEDFSVDSGRSQNSGCSSSSDDGAASISGTEVVDNDDISEIGSNIYLSTKNSYDHISPTPHGLVCTMCYC